MWKELRARQEGSLLPSSFLRRLRRRRFQSLNLSNTKEFITPHRGAINSLHIDLTEERYLLSGSSDGSAAIYDVQRASEFESGGFIAKHRHILLVDKQHEHGHKYAVTSAIWYPVDTGLFITGSFDHYVKVWDTNTTQVVMDFKMPGKVYGTAMSSVASTHMLIAAGSEDVQVRLCDIASGAFTHTLSGHRDGIMSLEWSASSEYILMTGGCDGAIRFWDIRRAGCFRVLDQSKTQLGRRPPFLLKSTKKGPASRIVQNQKRVSVGNGKRQLTTTRKGDYQRKGGDVQRLHPGMVSSLNRATAHYGAVTGLRAIEDGMYLLSSGSDSRIRLWDIESGCNTLVNYEATRLQATKPLQLAFPEDSSLVFVPCMTTIKAYDLWSGLTSQILRGHYESVNCCCFSSQDQELYSGSNDRQILVWSPSSPTSTLLDEDGKGGKILANCDSWSD